MTIKIWFLFLLYDKLRSICFDPNKIDYKYKLKKIPLRQLTTHRL